MLLLQDDFYVDFADELVGGFTSTAVLEQGISQHIMLIPCLALL